MRSSASSALVLFACTAPAEPVSGVDASIDAHDAVSDAPPGELSFASYTIPAGAHTAMLKDGEPNNPITAFTSVAGRDYTFVLDPSAMYVLTSPVQPEDQLDWNKLPGLSDCGQIDLAKDGLMFGWRWRLDTVPRVLEVTAYANNGGVHLQSASAMVTLDADDLAARAPLRYRIAREHAQYTFRITGTVRGRAVDATATLPRRCTGTTLTPTAWAGAFYFGGTSTAPSPITGRIAEHTF